MVLFLRRFSDILKSISILWALMLGRFIVAVIFWRSGQTKIEGFKLDPLNGEYIWGWPRLSDSVVFLFTQEYRLPLIDPTIAAIMAAAAEHLFPVLLILGLLTRISALSLLIMTAVIQLFVYPDAWITHGLWAAILLMLIARGAGPLSLDRFLRI